MLNPTQAQIQNEERVVAELARLGVCYLSRQSADPAGRQRAPKELLAELVCQPSSRVRTAVIALLLAHPGYSRHISSAIRMSSPERARILKIFYTAAMLLQALKATELSAFLGSRWKRLPDLFSVELDLGGYSPEERLDELAQHHAKLTGEYLNWRGTYEHAVRNLLRQWELEQQWNQ